MIAVILFYETNGLINKVLERVGLDRRSRGSPTDGRGEDLGDAVSVWLRVGFNMIIYLAGLQGISPELYEAARIDGATRVADSSAASPCRSSGRARSSC